MSNKSGTTHNDSLQGSYWIILGRSKDNDNEVIRTQVIEKYICLFFCVSVSLISFFSTKVKDANNSFLGYFFVTC